jgi:endo-1,4-beta-mannosidase
MRRLSWFAVVWCSLVALLPSPAASQGPLPQVRLSGNYFLRNGRPFIPAGVNWVPAKAAMQWPMEWDAASVEADFRKMRELGVNTVRLDMVWAWFEPRPGDYNPAAFAQLDALIKLARRFEIYLQPSLFIGNEVGEAIWDVPWRNGRHPHADPEMLRLETNLAAEFGRRYANETAIQSWDLTDEPPFWNAGKTTDAMAINWTRLIAGAIRRSDTLHPIVVGTDAQDIGHGPFRPDNILGEVDFLSVHPYPVYNPELFPDPLLAERTTYAAAFQAALSGGAGKPVMVQEMGASSAQQTPERIARYLRANLYSALGGGANGFLLWCFTDAAPQTYQRIPYRRAPHETQFGLTTWDGNDRPAGTEFRRFSRRLDRLDLTGVEPAHAEAGIMVPFEWSKPYGELRGLGLPQYGGVPYVSDQEPGSVAGQDGADYGELSADLAATWLNSFVLARRAGLRASFPRESSDWSRLPMLLLPSPLTSSKRNLLHVHTTFWQRAKDYVRGGGALYVSLNGESAIPEMEELFGARLADRIPAHDLRIKVVAPFGDLKPGDEFAFASGGATGDWGALLEPRDGQVIATDQSGHPALIAHTLGKGKVLTCAYPIEKYLSRVPAAFDDGDSTHRVYRALAEWAGVEPLFRSDRAEVEAAALTGPGRGYVVLTNHSDAAQSVTVTALKALRSVQLVQPEGDSPLELHGKVFAIRMAPFGGEIVEYRELPQ